METTPNAATAVVIRAHPTTPSTAAIEAEENEAPAQKSENALSAFISSFVGATCGLMIYYFVKG
ncbi:hypothetical protein ACHAXM_006276 [Skeletonema potamos]|jgi:hypothetical protein